MSNDTTNKSKKLTKPTEKEKSNGTNEKGKEITIALAR